MVAATPIKAAIFEGVMKVDMLKKNKHVRIDSVRSLIDLF